MKSTLLRKMWADYDPTVERSCKVVVYANKTEQLSNRPDLEPIPVVVVSRDLWRRLLVKPKRKGRHE